jgi:gamma-glutamylcyclotransferase (GGCT)/AIG2-like uncharacterized protein YtfP
MLLAAYGTLRPGCQGQEHLGIRLVEAGAAELPGRLWLTASAEPEFQGTVVPGFIPEDGHWTQAVLLQVPEALWPTLDAWENYQEDDLANSQYRREMISTRDGRQVAVYILQAPAINFIRGGDWLRYAAHPKSIPALRPDLPGQ